MTQSTQAGPTLAELRELLTRAYLSGDGAAVVTLMEQITAAEQQAPAQPSRAA